MLSAIEPEALRRRLRLRVDGRVEAVIGLLVEGSCPGAAVGDLVEICPRSGAPAVAAEIVGLRGGSVLAMSLGNLRGISGGDRVSHLGVPATIACGDGVLGRVIDARGRALDRDLGPIPGPLVHRPLYAAAPSPLTRRLIDEPLRLGVRAIDGPLALGVGQRVGIVAGAGVGKSRLLAMMAQGAEVDVCVAALIGERGREVGEFVEVVLTPEARRRTVVVAVTSDQSPLDRMRGAFAATAIAEHFAAAGKRVLLLMDSLTRFAMAQRELGLSAGEPPATRGYTPSVFAALPRLLERAGNFASGGSITGIYTVLVEGDDISDPISDASRAILDGHIVLSRDLADRGHYPAIDVLGSVSRVAASVMQPAHLAIAACFRQTVADLRDAQELVSIGAYVPGVAPALDRALRLRGEINGFLRQASGEPAPYPETVKRMAQLSGEAGAA